MNRFKRIATGGWLGRFLSVVTRGYYPFADEVAALVGTYGTIFSPAWIGDICTMQADGFMQERSALGVVATVDSSGAIMGPSNTGEIGRV